MARIEKTVFLSYRRTDAAWALSIFTWLRQHGYDVFIDYEGIASGAFGTVIVENILVRAHFLILLSPSALDRCDDSGDWLRLEIETAMKYGRNVVPIMVDGFSFRDQNVAAKLTGLLSHLSEYNGLDVSVSTFEDKMERLSSRFLNVALANVAHPPAIKAIQADAVLHNASPKALQFAKEQQAKAEAAPHSVVKTEGKWPLNAKRRRRLATVAIIGLAAAVFAGILVVFFPIKSLKPGQASSEPGSPASVYGICIQEASKEPVAGEEFGDELLTRISLAMGVAAPVDAVPCGYVQKVHAWYFEEREYILYNPIWLREVIGKDRAQATAIFAHELAHFVNRDFTANRDLGTKQKELAADEFSGCAVSRLNGDWAKLEDLFFRIRGKDSEYYPGVEQSLAAARQGFEGCSAQK